MQIAAQHPEAERERARPYMKERFLLDGVALDAADVAPWHAQDAVAIEADLADADVAFRDRAFVAAGITPQPPPVDGLDQLGRCLRRPRLQDVGKRRPASALALRRGSHESSLPPLSWRTGAVVVEQHPCGRRAEQDLRSRISTRSAPRRRGWRPRTARLRQSPCGGASRRARRGTGARATHTGMRQVS